MPPSQGSQRCCDGAAWRHATPALACASQDEPRGFLQTPPALSQQQNRSTIVPRCQERKPRGGILQGGHGVERPQEALPGAVCGPAPQQVGQRVSCASPPAQTPALCRNAPQQPRGNKVPAPCKLLCARRGSRHDSPIALEIHGRCQGPSTRRERKTSPFAGSRQRGRLSLCDETCPSPSTGDTELEPRSSLRPALGSASQGKRGRDCPDRPQWHTWREEHSRGRRHCISIAPPPLAPGSSGFFRPDARGTGHFCDALPFRSVAGVSQQPRSWQRTAAREAGWKSLASPRL